MPPSASSNLPMRRATAPVKAPFSWPNSSDSSRFSGIAAQLTATNGPCGAAAVAVDGARHQLLAGAALAGDQHAGLGGGNWRGACQHARPSRVAQTSSCRSSPAAARMAAISSASGGSGRNSLAPARIARDRRARRRQSHAAGDDRAGRCARAASARDQPADVVARRRAAAGRRRARRAAARARPPASPRGAPRRRAPRRCAPPRPISAASAADDQQPHGSPRRRPRSSSRQSPLTISVMVTPRWSSTTSTSPRATRRLLT